jgi:ribosomal-protein-alanine N-acetyltransferase
VIWWPEEIPTLSAVSDRSPLSFAITLRPVVPSDAEAIYRGAQDPEVPKFTTLPANYSLDNAINFAKNRAPERHANRLELIFAIDSNLVDQNRKSANQIGKPTYSLGQTELENNNSQLAGIISLHSIDFANHRAEIGYWLVKEARNKGVGTVSVELLTDYGLMTMGFRRIDALVDNRNEPSKRLLEKAGYQFEGLLKNYVTRPDGSQIDMAIFAATTK